MAFSTVLGSGGANDTFAGTTGVDAIALSNSEGNFFLGCNQADDNVQIINSGSPLYSGVLTTATIKGGQGEDTLTLGDATRTVFTGFFVNGNSDRDTIASNAINTFIASTIHGGAANDDITTAILTTTLVNGNQGVDTITLGAGVATTSSTIYGGGGNDVIDSGTGTTTNSLISGDLGNDVITMTNGGASIDGLTVTGGDGVDTIDLDDAGIAANDNIFVSGNDGNDTLTGTTVAVTEITIAGGAGDDTINSGTGTTTATGGLGSDTMEAGAGTNTFLYTATGQGGASASATGTGVLAAGDVIGGGTAFTTAVDRLTFDTSETLVGSSSSLTSGAAGAWNMSTAGVFRVTGSTFEYTAGTSTAAQIAGAVGAVVGDAGDTAYFTIGDTTTATQSIVVEVTLGTTREVGAATALNAGDTVSLLADVTSGGAFLAAADFTFV